ncbi:16S ribosomal RNA methyltransferase RsmE [Helicobacter sp. NHP19-003]|uniref:Ribosomal RNA small subunit methyltransferase E n=1 Tax=Helicobacter gastrocanis TaxID=2849641 RepID=A0ABM7S8Z6_9HELI|nr:16S rRNA (uracil(1498)-N(3))-methyltransferase [Helicobacter sp. NHP19-003]BCZ17019.1 16S ribosomal RNA methyltransferase RsmE [Helicobacter sp. NHP19-003]
MRFLYHPQAGAPTLNLEDQAYKHIYLSRRTQATEPLPLRNLKDDNLYFYKPLSVQKHRATLELAATQEKPSCSQKGAHLIWAHINAKNIEKVLPYLNQMGVLKISFFMAEFSQRNERLDKNKLERFTRILIASCEQCGRSDLMPLEVLKDLKSALESYPEAGVLDLNGEAGGLNAQQGILIGPEGGFSPSERELFKNRKIFSPSHLVLTSEGAALFSAALGTV